MADISTRYMGIPLASPLVAGASNLSTNPERLHQLQEAGAGAVVYKSLFEEQIALENWQLQAEQEQYAERHAEMISLFPRIEHAGTEAHLLRLKEARQILQIPLIASLNATSSFAWEEYSMQLADSGVDGLELNFYHLPSGFDSTASRIEDELLFSLARVLEKVSIPVSVKLSPFYTNVLHLLREIDRLGVQGLVLFNRLFQPDIDILQESHIFPWNLSHEGDGRLALRYSGLLYGEVQASVIASGGILSSRDVIQQILAGADAVQLVSALYYRGIPYLSQIRQELTDWMDSKGYSSLDDFRGHLSRRQVKDPLAYQRGQYVDILFQRTQDVLRENSLP